MTAPADATYRDRILSLLGDQDPVPSLERTARGVREVVGRLGPGGLARRRGTGTWSGRQILAHLADSELAIGFRIRQVLTEDGHRIQPFDQERWAARYEDVDPELALRAFTTFREWNLALIRQLTPEDLSRETVHPERGPETLGTIVRLLAGHDLNHLRQLETLLTTP